MTVDDMKPWPLCEACHASLVRIAVEPLVGGDPETCAACGTETRAGIYIYQTASPPRFQVERVVRFTPRDVPGVSQEVLDAMTDEEKERAFTCWLLRV